jgi:hypothetical protein
VPAWPGETAEVPLEGEPGSELADDAGTESAGSGAKLVGREGAAGRGRVGAPTTGSVASIVSRLATAVPGFVSTTPLTTLVINGDERALEDVVGVGEGVGPAGTN